MNTNAESIAGQYAEAVLDLAGPTGVDEAVATDLAAVSKVLRNAPELKLFLGHPSVPGSEKKKMLLQLFAGKINELTQRLLELLADRRRLELLPHIETRYRALMNDRKNIVNASLSCSEPLSGEAVANIKARLTEHLGRKLELQVNVDPSLIGGVVLRVGDQVMDGSIRGKLRAIEKSLLAV